MKGTKQTVKEYKPSRTVIYETYRWWWSVTILSHWYHPPRTITSDVVNFRFR